ncbi:hypothetical protein K2173_025781 [Erythroxylum novogranatense]|uniref:DUF506 family protein n=1 Tax=Erythroxylum novogranatense TaxID=1862640 RepID=A0AAV8SH84_9ROSI|nr:hypothetical protein K2173_025781 [Erythroxylum novogranatense]
MARFKRVAAAFDEAARVRLCESSGSDYFSPGNSAHLSDLVNSFIERDYVNSDVVVNSDQRSRLENDNGKIDDSEMCWSDSDTKVMLENLFLSNYQDLDIREKIASEAKLACEEIGDRSSQGFKRALMSRLRDRGFDAGLCKSRWEKFGKHPAGDYEYVDVNVGGNRYIVEAYLAREFEIARSTIKYGVLLNVIPNVFVGKADELKQVVRLMCSAIRESMKSSGLHVPPWRRNGYMQAKWFGPYKRTTSQFSSKKGLQHEAFSGKISFGFEAFQRRVSSHCRGDIGNKIDLKVSQLTAAFNCNS